MKGTPSHPTSSPTVVEVHSSNAFLQHNYNSLNMSREIYSFANTVIKISSVLLHGRSFSPVIMIVIGRMHFCSGVGVEVFGQLHSIITDVSREGKTLQVPR